MGELVQLVEGEEVGPFRVVRPIGKGGFGVVYLARDLRLGRRIALKLLTGDAPVGLAEARAAAQLNHPNIVTVYDVGEHRGQPYLALEYVPGDTLRDRLERERIPLADALGLARELAEAVAAAHDAGIAHLDLTPGNVIIGQDGRLRVVDFGLARPVAAAGDGKVSGTPGYMAPEQWMGQALGPATDSWALGVMLHELVSGKRPLAELSAALLRHRVCDPEAMPLDPGLAAQPALAALIGECLAKAPAARPPAAAVAARLAGVASGVDAGGEPEPFRGLIAYDEGSAAVFSGRDDDVAALLERLRTSAAVCVTGPSGAGKSSLLRAGVAPRLRARGWTVLTVRPGSDPMAAIAGALAGHQSSVNSDPVGTVVSDAGADTGRTVTARSRRAPDPAERVARWRRSPALLGLDLADVAEATGGSLALIIDPLEEVETLVEPDQRGVAVEALAGAADDPDGPVRLVLGLRDDFLGRVAARLPEGATLGHIHLLAVPGPAALRTVLERPIAAAGYRWEPGVVDDLVRTVRSEAAALSLIQVSGAALWERRDRERRLLTRAAHDEIGGVPGAFADHADRALATSDPDELAAARALLLRLVAADGTRRPRARAELVDGLGASAGRALDRLIAARVVTTRRTTGAGDQLELAHELLVRRWRTLASWIDESRGERASLDELLAAAQRWRAHDRSPDELWRGEALVEARRRTERAIAPVPDAVAEFVGAASERERRRRWRLRIAAVLALLAIAGVGVVLASQRREARSQAQLASRREADALVEASWSALAERRVIEARALLRSAAEIAVTDDTRALYWRLAVEPTLLHIDLPITIGQLAWVGADGLVLVGSDPYVRAVDLATRELRVLGRHTADTIAALAPSPVADEVTTGANDRTVMTWPLHGGAGRLLGRHDASVQAVAYSADGRWIAAGDAGGAVIVRGAADGAEAWRIRLPTGVAQVAFLGDMIAVIDSGGQALIADRSDARWPVCDGARALAADADGALWVGRDDGRVIRVLRPGESPRTELLAHGAALSTLQAVGRRLVSAGHDGVARIWERGGELAEAPLPAPGMHAARLDRRGTRLAIAASRTLVVRDVTRPALPADGGFHGSVTEVCFARGGQLVIGVGDDGVLRSFAAATGRAVASRPTGSGRIRGLACDGETVITGGDDGSVRRWRAADLGGGDLLGRHDGPAVDIAIAGDLVASASLDHTVRLWAPAGARVLRAGAPVYAVVLAPARGLVAALTDDVLLWPLAGDAGPRVLMRGAATRNDLALLGDGRRLVAIGENPQMVFDLAGGPSATFTTPQVAYSGAATTTGARVVLVGWGGFGGIVDLDAGRTVALGEHYLDFNTARFAPGGLHVATAGEDGLVGMWRASDGRFAWGERATAAPLGLSADAADATRDVPTATLTAGPLRFTGHSSGLVTIDAGARRSARFHLHGAITALVRAGAGAEARTVTGAAAPIPLPGLDDSACALVQSLWREVPVAWHDGRVQRAAPPAGHPCR